MSNIEELQGVIHKLHGAKATHRESVPVKEVFRGETIWDGVVEVFDLHDHPKTHRAYAWSHETDDPKQPQQHVTVLHIPPAVSPQTAVQAAIMQEIRNAPRPSLSRVLLVVHGSPRGWRRATSCLYGSPEDRAKVEAAATSRGLSISEWIRRTIHAAL